MRWSSTSHVVSMIALCGSLPCGIAALGAQEPPSAAPAEPAAADEEAPGEPFEIGGFADLYYGWNGNRPFDRESFFPGAGVAAKRSDEIALNWAAVSLDREPDPVGFHLVVGAGNAMEILHLGEPAGEAVGRDVFRNVYRASVTYAASDRLVLEGGIYPSHIGFETAIPRDNWNYTGSWAANFTPYYQTGVKAVYTFSDHWSGGLHVLNGWQIIGDNNDAKSLGTQLTWTSSRASVSVNGWIGPELPDDNKSQRTLLDLVASAKITDGLELAFEGDLGKQELPDSADAEWTALVGYARYRFRPESALAVRLERFDDPDGGISGLAQTLDSATLTCEHRLHEHVLLKLEGRYDRSTAAVFTGEAAGQPDKDQLLFVLGSIFSF